MLSSDKKSPLAPYSIITRLTIGYVSLSIVVLSCGALFLYYSLSYTIQNKDKRFLENKIEHFKNILKDGQYAQQVLENEVNEGGSSPFHKYLVRISDIKGSLIMVTNEGRLHIAKLPFSSPHEMDEKLGEFQKYQSKNGQAFMLMSAWAKSPRYPGGKVLLNTAIDITEEQDLLSYYRNIILFAMFCAILFAFVPTIIVARHGLRPLNVISNAVQKVNVSRLHERLNPQQWPLELVPLVANFDKMLDRLEDSVKRLSKFSSDIAHELRTPIQTLMGEAEIMLSESRTIEQYQENIQSNLEEYDTLTHMIEGLLFIARAENIELGLNKIEFDINTKVQKIIEFYDALKEEKSITLVFIGKGTLYADPLLFERSISNLISNAIKYSDHGGQIKIYAVENKDQTVSVSVNNKGQVIEPEEIKNIFDRFFRASYAKKVDHNGLGLGLSIVKSIMDIHGGTIQAQSDSVTGTTFILKFPPK